jgi:DnaD/phage-associated family protein
MSGTTRKNPGRRPSQFAGFSSGKSNWINLPSPFFSDLMPLVDDLAELKLLLFFFWALPQLEGDFRYLRQRNFSNDQALMQGLAITNPDADPQEILKTALARAVQRKALLRADVSLPRGTDTLYFLNTERGRIAIDQIKAGHWQPGDSDNPVEILPEPPNIYRLYEENIGALTPLIADELKDMEGEFPVIWIKDAIRIAVQNEARNLRYVRAVLERWRKEGRSDAATRRQDEEDPERYISGKYADFIDH